MGLRAISGSIQLFPELAYQHHNLRFSDAADDAGNNFRSYVADHFDGIIRSGSPLPSMPSKRRPGNILAGVFLLGPSAGSLCSAPVKGGLVSARCADSLTVRPAGKSEPANQGIFQMWIDNIRTDQQSGPDGRDNTACSLMLHAPYQNSSNSFRRDLA